MAADQHDADGDERHGQNDAAQTHDGTEEAGKSVPDRACAIGVDAETGNQAEGDEEDPPHVTAVTGQDPFSLWWDDVSSG